MCTKIFSVPPSRISRVERKTEANKSGHLTDRSTPLNVPLLKEEGVSLSFSLDRGDSGEFVFFSFTGLIEILIIHCTEMVFFYLYGL